MMVQQSYDTVRTAPEAITTVKSAASRFAQSRAGNIGMIFALMITPILITVGMAVDLVNSIQLRAQLSEAADSGLLAAARAKSVDSKLSDADAQAIAKRYFDGNFNKAGVSIGQFSFRTVSAGNDTAFELDIAGKVKTRILDIIGREYIQIGIRSEAKVSSPRDLEIVMVLDNTGSMSGNRITTLKQAANDLVSTVMSRKDSNAKIGIVPFAQYVNVGTKHQRASWMTIKRDKQYPNFNGCVGSRDYPYNVQDGNFTGANLVQGLTGIPCPQEVLALTTVQSDVESKIKAMRAGGATYIPAGLTWGLRLLSKEEPFTEGEAYDVMAAKGGIKAIVLMTDGENSAGPIYPKHGGRDTVAANNLTRETCVEAKDKDITVYTIAFEVRNNTTKRLLEDCATSPEAYFDATNAADLARAFDAIAHSLTDLALTH